MTTSAPGSPASTIPTRAETGAPPGPEAQWSADRLDRHMAKLVVGVFGLAVVLLLGKYLVGGAALIATDQMLSYAPWNAVVPDGFRPSPGAWSDTYDIWEPQRLLFADSLRHGQLALWNPFPSGGAPLAAEPSTGTFGPFQLVYLLVPGWYAPALVKLAELVVSASFTFLFLRAVGTTRTAAAIGGTIYAFNGFQLVWTNWPQTRVGALVPVLFWAVERLLQRPDARAIAITALVVGAMLLEGFPAVTLCAVGAAGLYAAVRSLADRGRFGGGARVLRWLGLAQPVALVAVGVGLGLGLAAVQLLPFQDRLAALGLSRDQSSANHIDPLAVFTMAAPGAFGSPLERRYLLRDNYVETLSYVGAAACALATMALLRRRRGPGSNVPTIRRGVRLYAALAVLVLLVLLFVGGPLLGLLQTVPPLSTNRVGRLRGLLAFFVTVLAALAVDDLVVRAFRRLGAVASNGTDNNPNGTGTGTGTGGEDRRASADAAPGGATGKTGPQRDWVRLVGCGALAVTFGVGVVWLLAWAGDHSYVRELSHDLLAAGALAAVTVAAVVVVGRRPRLVVPAVFVVAVAVVGQGLALWSSYLPASDRDQWFGRTPMHDFLDRNLGDERVAPADTTLMAGSTSYYGIRTVTGHVFTQPTWATLLKAVDAPAFEASPTNSRLRGRAEMAASPVLDRMGARYYATALGAPVLGAGIPPTLDDGLAPIRLDAGMTVTVPFRAQRLRAVAVPLVEPAVTDDPLAYLRVTVRLPDGMAIAAGALRVNGSQGGMPTIPVAAEAATADRQTDLLAEVTFDADDGTAALGVGADGQAAVGSIRGADRLRLVFTDGGQLYERLDALPRVRWAADAEVVPDPDTRVAMLKAGVPDDTVLLSRPPSVRWVDAAGDTGAEGSGKAVLVDDRLDSQVVHVDAPEAGYVVVADALQIGWEATVDGEPAELLDADHAMGAVRVPAGQHVVELRFAPPGIRLGMAVTALSAMVLVVLLALPAIRRRRAPRRVATETLSSS